MIAGVTSGFATGFEGLAPIQNAVVLFSRGWSGTMLQLTYEEIRLLQELKSRNRTISGHKPRGDFDRLVKGDYVTVRCLNVSETLYSITAKGLAALHEAEGND
jgi:hypothetical protein